MGATTHGRTDQVLASVPDGGYAFPDPGLAVDPPIIATHPDDVAEVRVLDGYRLYVRFFDGTDGTVEMRELIFGKNAGVFAALSSADEFGKIGLGLGTVMWANELDLAPDVMYEEFKRHGVWVLR